MEGCSSEFYTEIRTRASNRLAENVTAATRIRSCRRQRNSSNCTLAEEESTASMAGNLRSRREWNIEAGRITPPAENESVMMKIRTFLMDKGRVSKRVIRELGFLVCLWGFMLVLVSWLNHISNASFKLVLRKVAPDALSREENERYFWWVYFGINLMGLLLVGGYLIHICLRKRDH